MSDTLIEQLQIGMASAKCNSCRGLGLIRGGLRRKEKTCPCVFRNIFTVCHEKYCNLRESPRGVPIMVNRSWVYCDGTFVADFEKIGNNIPPEYNKLFRSFFIDGHESITDRSQYHWTTKIKELGGEFLVRAEIFPYYLSEVKNKSKGVVYETI